MKLKKMMMSGLCACLMLGTLAGCGSAQGDDAQSEDPTVILVGVSPDYPPYESLDSDGNIVYTYVRPYARFADADVPAGTVSLTGILQYDAAGDGRYILKPRDESDCRP